MGVSGSGCKYNKHQSQWFFFFFFFLFVAYQWRNILGQPGPYHRGPTPWPIIVELEVADFRSHQVSVRTPSGLRGQK